MPGSAGAAELQSSVVPDSTPLAPPPVFGRAAIRKKTRKRTTQRLVRVGVVVVALLVVIVGATVGYAEYRNHQITRIKVGNLVALPPSGVENIVLVGSTSRCALKQQNKAFGLCSQGVTGVNSDVVMILHVNPNTKTAAILSIPRDLFVPNARASGPNKIDAALVEGPQQLVSAIQDDFGIPIHHYVELNFDSFQGVVNALGGIKMYFPEPVFDAYSGLNVPVAGCRQLNGFQALAVVRARHLQYKGPGVKTNDHADWPQDPESDLSRIRRDHEFLRVLASAMDKRGLSNPITDNDLLSAVAPQLQVDSGFSLGQMFGLVTTFHGINTAKTPQQTLPVVVLSSLNYYYQGYDYGNVELTSQPNDLQAVSSFLGLGADRDTMTGKPLPSPGSVTVSVLNGTGQTGQAGQTSDRAQDPGIRDGGGRGRCGGRLVVGDDRVLLVHEPPGRGRAGAALALGGGHPGDGRDDRRRRRHRGHGHELLGERPHVGQVLLEVDERRHLDIDTTAVRGGGAGGAHRAHPGAGALRPPVLHRLGRRGLLEAPARHSPLSPAEVRSVLAVLRHCTVGAMAWRSTRSRWRSTTARSEWMVGPPSRCGTRPRSSSLVWAAR